MSDKEKFFCNIIRDADKIDILRVVSETSSEYIYGIDEQAFKSELISDEVMQCFLEHHAVLRSLLKSHIDNIVGYAAFVFELCYLESRRLCVEQGHIWEVLDFRSDVADVNEIEDMRRASKKWLEE